MSDLGELLRLGARAGAFVGTTLALWVCFDLDWLVTAETDRDRLRHKWVVRWARTLLSIWSVRVDTAGAAVPCPGRDAAGRGRVFVMNHRSGMDIAVAHAIAEAHVVSRADLGGWPLVGRGARKIGTLFVDRSSARSGAAVMRAMIRSVEAGRAVMVFPEGTSHAGDEVRPLRLGAFQVARRTGAEIVPIGIAWDDARAVYGEESFLDHLRRVSGLRHMRAAVEIGAPLRAEGSASELCQAARATLQALVDRARARLR